MKAQDFTPAIAVTADQRHSRRRPDAVPEALAALADCGDWLLGFERTAGDEVQGLTDDPAAVVRAVVALTRLGQWRVGIGLGTVDLPLPSSTRAARGSAYLAARQAIEDAHRETTGLCVRAEPAEIVSVPGYGEAVRDAETALWLVHQVLARRSEQGWQVVDLVDEGLSGAEAAVRLGVSASAVSQRLARANRTEVARGVELCRSLLGRALFLVPMPEGKP